MLLMEQQIALCNSVALEELMFILTYLHVSLVRHHDILRAINFGPIQT
jgi:hypothetical protein